MVCYIITSNDESQTGETSVQRLRYEQGSLHVLFLSVETDNQLALAYLMPKV